MEPRQEIGRITHFYPKISVAVVELKAPLAVGEEVSVLGNTTHFEEVVGLTLFYFWVRRCRICG